MGRLNQKIKRMLRLTEAVSVFSVKWSCSFVIDMEKFFIYNLIQSRKLKKIFTTQKDLKDSKEIQLKRKNPPPIREKL